MTAWRHPEAKTCPTCGTEFRPWQSLQRYCSRACVVRPRVYGGAHCKRCGAAFQAGPTRQYCSRECGWQARHERSWADETCLNCAKVFRRRTQPSHRNHRVFCSTTCSQNYTAGQNHPAWRGGRDPFFGSRWLRLAESIRERDGRRCRRCGKPEAENGRKLPIDHVVPRRDWATIEEANDPSNLVALCDSCHGKKTMGAERRWLRGDVLDMQSYRIAVAQPWTKP